MAIGGGVLAGWLLSPQWLRAVSPIHVPMNPLTAACLILGGAAIAIQSDDRGRLVMLLGGAVALGGLWKFAEIGMGLPALDGVLFADQLDGAPGSIPSRMAPNTALGLVLAGAALLLLRARGPAARMASQFCAISLLLLLILAMTGYLFDLEPLRKVAFYTAMKPETVLGLGMIAIGALARTRGGGMIALLRDNGPAGAICRLILPLTLAAPLVAGLLRLWGQKQGYFSEQTAIALQVTVQAALTLALLMASVIALDRSDRARRARERALRESEQFNRLIAATNPDSICLLDEDGLIGFANEAAVSMSGRSIGEIVGQRWGYGFDAITRDQRDTALAAAREGGVGRLTVRIARAQGAVSWFDSLISRLPSDHDWPFRFLVVSRDVTDKRNSEERDQWKATHDALTELPNRTSFQEQLDYRIATESGGGFAVLLIDIDNFKLVNDTLGHDAGDALLRSVARRITHAVRDCDVVSRVAGDEFAVLLDSVRSEQGALAIAERIIDSFRDPWVHKSRIADCRISVGVALASRHGRSGPELLKNADIALFAAKARGKGQIAVFRSGMKAAVQRRTRQIELAREALHQNLIVPYYQPKVALASGRLAGFEALLRWRHRQRGVQLPATIAAAFEDLELAGEITDRMLEQVIADMTRWLAQDVGFGHVAINLTAADLRQHDFAERLIARLDANAIPRCHLQVEVTETVFLGRGAEYVERALKTLNAAGIRVALDDFGTGYASLSHLKQFPVDIVKIDRSFLNDVEHNVHNDAIINTVISLGHSLNIEIVAEGVETFEQERRLTARGCTYGQGYYFSKAVPATRVPRLAGMTFRGEHTRDADETIGSESEAA